MAVRIRLKRLGAKKAPFYRIVVADSRTSRNSSINIAPKNHSGFLHFSKLQSACIFVQG